MRGSRSHSWNPRNIILLRIGIRLIRIVLPAGQTRQILGTALIERIETIFLRRGTPRSFAAGETIFRVGGAADAIYLIRRGTVQVHLPGVVKERGPGEIIGEMAFADRRGIRTATVTARTPVEVLAVTDDELRRLLSSHFAARLDRLAAMRMEDWPLVDIRGQGVRIIGIEPESPYYDLVQRALDHEPTRRRIIEAAGFDPEVPDIALVVHDVQFGGVGSIKYVVRVGGEISVPGDGPQRFSVGLRFYETRLFGNARRANAAARDEAAEAQRFLRHDKTVVKLGVYQSAGEFPEPDEIAFLSMGVAGFSVGEFVVVRPPEAYAVHGETGIRTEHFEDVIATVTRGWLGRLNEDPVGRLRMGPTILDLKRENFVWDRRSSEGLPARYLDLGCIHWCTLSQLRTSIEQFLTDEIPWTPEAFRHEVLSRGMRRGILGLVEERILDLDADGAVRAGMIRSLARMLDQLRRSYEPNLWVHQLQDELRFMADYVDDAPKGP